MRTTIPVAAVALGAALSWQLLVVYSQYGGDWIGLYQTGDHYPPPRELTERIPTLPNSDGYDGQWYHYIAHDPVMRRGFDRYVDAPRLRYRRILVPALANLLAGGRDSYVDRAYVGVLLLSVFLGTLWTGAFAKRHGFSAWLGLGFLFTPGVLISVDRLTVDGVLAAACAGFLWLLDTDPGWLLYALLAAAPLVRETGLVLLGGYVASLLWQCRFARAAVFSTCAVPSALWFWWVGSHTGVTPTPWFHNLPLAGYLYQLMHPNSYSLGSVATLLVTILDYVAMVGVAVAIFCAITLLRLRIFTAVSVAVCGFTALACLLPRGEFWSDPNSYQRILTPLFLMLALESLRKRRMAMVMPVLMVTPRICVQFVGMGWRVLRAIMGQV